MSSARTCGLLLTKDRIRLTRWCVGSLKKTKAKYDGSCSELESKRKKTDSSFDMK